MVTPVAAGSAAAGSAGSGSVGSGPVGAASPPLTLSRAAARRIWLHAQRLDTLAPFGSGPEAVSAAVDHLGYGQIDTINVIERCHHHILWTRIQT